MDVLALCLHNMNIDYCNLSALEIHKSMRIKRGNSDKKDALVIVNYALVNRFKLKTSTFTEKHLIELKLLYTQREKPPKQYVNTIIVKKMNYFSLKIYLLNF